MPGQKIIAGNFKIALAVSGGADSMYMAMKFALNNHEAICLIVDHKLRDESGAEALWVMNYLQNKGIPTRILTWEHKGINGNIQEKARHARYKLLTDYCKSNDIPALYTAHNSSDQVETILYRIIRGTGVDGLVGIRESIDLNGVEVSRPILHKSRPEIEEELNLHGWQWVEDPSNKSLKYDRVKIRNWIKSCPMQDKLNASCAELSKNCVSTARYLQNQTANFIAKNIKFHSLGFVTVPPSAWQMDDEICLRALKKIVAKVSFEQKSPKSTSFVALLKSLRSWAGASKTLMKCQIFFKDGQFYFIPEHKLMPVLDVSSTGNHTYFDMEVHCPIAPCKIRALGDEGWKQLPLEYRKLIPDHRIGKTLIGVFQANDDTLISVPQVNYKA